MGTELDATEIAATLLLEARALVAGEGRAESPIRCGRTSALGALTTAWATFPGRQVAEGDGFALARRALHGAAGDTSLSEVAPPVVLRDAFDRALEVVRA